VSAGRWGCSGSVTWLNQVQSIIRPILPHPQRYEVALECTLVFACGAEEFWRFGWSGSSYKAEGRALHGATARGWALAANTRVVLGVYSEQLPCDARQRPPFRHALEALQSASEATTQLTPLTEHRPAF